MAAIKEYGLIKRGLKKDVPIVAKPSIFDSESSDEDGRPHSVGKTLKKEADRIQNKKQVKINISNAIADDPTVYQYDEIYDDMVKTKEEQVVLSKNKIDSKPRYIDILMKTAKARKLDQERTYERKVQKEREAEGEEFADKDAFVTSAYKKKMLEMQELDEKDKKEAEIEALNDVTKKSDLSGFYHSLYNQTVGKEPSSANDQNETPQLLTKIKEEPKSEGEGDDDILRTNNLKDKKQRQWRSRKRHSSSESEKEIMKPSNSKEKERYRRDRSRSTSSNENRRLDKQSKDSKISGKDQRRSRKHSSSSDREVRHRSIKQEPGHRRSNRRSSSREASTSFNRQRQKEQDLKLKENNRKRRGSSSSDSGSNSKHMKKMNTSKDSKSSRSDRHKDSSPRGKSRRENEESLIEKSGHSKSIAKTTDDRKVVKIKEENINDEKDLQQKEGDEKTKSDPILILEKLKVIFAKRHIGELFEDARDRYLIRKRNRPAMV